MAMQLYRSSPTESSAQSMKTIEEWLDELPKSKRQAAINNILDQQPDALEFKVDSLGEAIASGFKWDATPEGVEYWNELTEKAEK
jgi:hypothetical protein